MSGAGQKQCTLCGQIKFLVDFGLNQGRPRSQCKPCRNLVKKSQRELNRDAVLAQKKAYRDARRVELAAKQKAYRDRDGDAYATMRRAWVAANVERIRGVRRAHAEKHPLRYAQYNIDRRVIQKKQTPAWADFEKMLDIYRQANDLRKMGIDVHVDHIYPIRGKNVCGFHSHDNLQLLFGPENMSKGAKNPDDL